MAVELASAYIAVSARTDGIPADIRRAFGQAERDVARSGQRAGSSFASGISGGLKSIAGIAGVTGGVAAIGAAFKSTVTAGMDFTNTLNTMRAVSSATDAQIASVSARARELGSDTTLTATSATDAATAMTELAKGGFSVDQSMQAAKGTLQLAAAAQITAGEAATIQSQALQAFGKDATYAGTAADILANAANQSSAEITDVAQALQQSGAVANQFGVSMQDSAATIALLANAGIQGSDAGTLLKSALLALTDQGKPAQAAMKDLGVSAYDAQGKFVGMEALFGQLQSASKRMTPEMYQAATATLFGSDAARLAGVAAQQGAGGFDKLRDAMGQQGAAADVAAAKTRGLPGAWEKFKNAAQDAALGVYDVIQGPLTTAANGATTALGGAFDAAERFGGEGLDKLRDSGFLSQAAQTFEKVRDAVVAAAPGVGRIAASLAQAGAVVGGAAWLAFSGALQVVAGALQTIAPLLEGVGNLMQGNQTVVTALLGAYLALKIIPGIVGRIGSAFSPITGRISATTTSVRSFNDQVRRLQTVSATTGTSVGRLGAQMAILGSNSPAIGRMRQAFVDASSAASRMPRTVGTAAGALSGLRTGIGAVSGAMGGPLGIALAAGTIAMGLWGKSQADAARDAAENKRQIDELSQAINFQTGALDAQGKKKVFDKLSDEKVFDTVDKNPQLGISAAQVQSAAEGQKSAIDTVNAALDRQAAKSIENSKYWQTNAKDYEKAGVSMQELTAAVRGNGNAQDAVKDKLEKAGWKDYDSAVGRAKSGLDAAGQSAIGLGEKIGSTNDTLGKSQERARQEAEALGLVSQRFEEIAKQFAAPGTNSIEVDTSQIAGAEERLKSLGFTTRSLPNGKVQINANDEAARARLQFISTNVNLLNSLSANPRIGLNDDAFTVGDQNARNALRGLASQVADPKARLTIDELINNKAVSVAELQQLSQTIADPKVRLEVEKVLQNIGIVNDNLDKAARTRTAQIIAKVVGDLGAGAGDAPNKDQLTEAQRKNLGFAAGGWTGPGSKHTAAGVVHADEFVVKKSSRRAIESKFPGALDFMNQKGSLPGYAEGGRVAADDFDKLAKGGFGASGPLEGSGYNWGGVNWGDCSGAMSAFARFAAGLATFGGRFATASMSGALKAMGALAGRGSAGDLRFGWHNGGPGGGHTSGTLPSGVNVEMGGGRGNGQYGGGAAGADDGQHTDHAYFPASMFQPLVSIDKYGTGEDRGGSLTQPEAQATSGAAAKPSLSSTISGRFGDAASAFVGGQLADALGVFGVSDQLAALEAQGKLQQSMDEYKRDRVTPGSPGDKTKDAETKLAQNQTEFQLKQEYELKQRNLKLQYEKDKAAKKPNAKADYDTKLFNLKREYDAAKFERSQGYKRESVKDPGTQKPKAGKDLGPLAHLGLQDNGGVIMPGLNLIQSKLNKPETTLPFSPREMLESMNRPSGGDDFSLVINNPIFSDRDSMMRTASRTQSRRAMQFMGRPRG